MTDYTNGYVEVTYLATGAWVAGNGTIYVRRFKVGIPTDTLGMEVIKYLMANGYHPPHTRKNEAEIYIPPSAMIEMRIYTK